MLFANVMDRLPRDDRRAGALQRSKRAFRCQSRVTPTLQDCIARPYIELHSLTDRDSVL